MTATSLGIGIGGGGGSSSSTCWPDVDGARQGGDDIYATSSKSAPSQGQGCRGTSTDGRLLRGGGNKPRLKISPDTTPLHRKTKRRRVFGTTLFSCRAIGAIGMGLISSTSCVTSS